MCTKPTSYIWVKFIRIKKVWREHRVTMFKIHQKSKSRSEVFNHKLLHVSCNNYQNCLSQLCDKDQHEFIHRVTFFIANNIWNTWKHSSTIVSPEFNFQLSRSSHLFPTLVSKPILSSVLSCQMCKFKLFDTCMYYRSRHSTICFHNHSNANYLNLF